MIRRCPTLLALVAMALVAVGCGDDGEDSTRPAFQSADDDAIALDDDVVVTTTTAGGGAGDGDAAGGGGTTIPLNEDDRDPGETMFDALQVFNQCLEELGTEFLGDPRSAEPGSPAADPDYLDDLGTCAARSNIVEAMTAMQDANEAMGPEEIEERNRNIEAWADCMRGRGWSLELVADDRGMLNPTGFESPDGAAAGGGLGDFFESDDFEECSGVAADGDTPGDGAGG